MIFPHPEKRLVELTPEGPVTYAFWRWTVRPTNNTSAILEALDVPYFDTTTRRFGVAAISPERVAYEEGAAASALSSAAQQAPPASSQLPGWSAAVVAGLVFALGLVATMTGRWGARRPRWLTWFDPDMRALRRAARGGDAKAVRGAMSRLLRGGLASDAGRRSLSASTARSSPHAPRRSI